MTVATLAQANSIPIELAENRPVPHWKVLARLSEAELGELDIALVQFVTMDGLPRSENLNVWGCIRTLNDWADGIYQYTDSQLPNFRRNSANYENSEAYFRALCMATVLQKEFGVRYDLEKVHREAPFGVEDRTVHGIIYGNGGTCASLPVLYAAIGRRLGYPIKLVTCYVDKDVLHQFARWDGNGVRFNIEATAQGLATPHDDRYRTGKYQMTPQMEKWGRYMLSMTPRMELKELLHDRARLLRDSGKRFLATEAVAWALALDPENVVAEDYLRISLNDWLRWTKERIPPGFPAITIGHPRGSRLFPEALPWKYEHDLLGLDATEKLLLDPELDRVWEKMRRGEWKGRGPNHAIVDYRPDGTSEVELTFNA